MKLSVFNKFYDENRLTGYGRAFARQLFNRGHKTLHLAFSEDKGSYIPPQEGKDYFLCTDDFRVFKNETYFESLEAISEELEVSFISEETQRVTNLILEGKDVHKVLSFHESMNKEFKTAAGQFPKKMEAFYIEVGGVNEAAINLQKYGRNYTQKGAYDREYLDWLKNEAADILNYYNTKIKFRIDALDLDEDDDDLNSLNDDVNTLEWVTKWDLDTIDLNKLKRAF